MRPSWRSSMPCRPSTGTPPGRCARCTASTRGDLAVAQYDFVCCMELLEHVPEPAVLIGELSRLLRPGGALFVSTINRTAQAFFGAIVAAEYVLGLLPRGTHEYARFVPPAEL